MHGHSNVLKIVAMEETKDKRYITFTTIGANQEHNLFKSYSVSWHK